MYDKNSFDGTLGLEAASAAIRAEFERVFEAHFMGYDGRFQLWPHEKLYSRGWNVFPLVEDLGEGPAVEVSENCALVPETTAALRRVASLRAARFCVLLPGGYVRPHVDREGSSIQGQLALLAPDRSAMRIGGRLHSASEGECRVFDGRQLREWWNYGGSPRVVLHMDLDPEGAGEPVEDVAGAQERCMGLWQRCRGGFYGASGLRPSGVLALPHKIVRRLLYAIGQGGPSDGR